MSGSFDPVSGRPTGSAPTEWSGRGKSLPSGSAPGKQPAKKARRDKRNAKGGNGTGLVVIGLVIGLCFIGAALISRSSGNSTASADPTTTTVTTTTASPTTTPPATTTTTTTATTSTTATTETTGTTAANGWLVIPVDALTGWPIHAEYQVPPDWQREDYVRIDDPDPTYQDYEYLQSAAEDQPACAIRPTAAGVFLDSRTGPTATQATDYAKGLATVAFSPSQRSRPTLTVTESRHIDGDGWIGREIVVHARLKAPLDCAQHEGVVVLLAIGADYDPDRTIMLAAYGGTDTPQGTNEATLRKIVESVSVTS